MLRLSDYFDQPSYLWLLLLLPIIWKLSYRSLGGLGRWRRLFALAFRSLVLIAIVMALAEFQYLRRSDRVTVIYLLDQSASIPQAQREAMVQYVKDAVKEYRQDAAGDRAALIVFGRNANIEVPPLNADLPVVGQLESLLDLRTDATNLAAAMKLAQATFPEDSAGRIVIVTDGNENMGDADAIARLLSENGIGIDVVPIDLGKRPEVYVERVAVPTDIRKGTPFQVRAVVNNDFEPTEGNSGDVNGTLRLTRRAGERVEVLAEEQVTLSPGKNVFPISNKIDQPDFYEYETVFVPDRTEDDVMPQNNRATAFTQVLGEGHVLLIEDWESPGEFDYLIDRLRNMNIQVTVTSTKTLFSSLAELQRYDSIILANVARSTGGEAEGYSFSDNQIDMLVHNTQDMGCGLVMLGGPQSFGAGGWSNTELEKAMPVDFQIQNAKVVPVGALAMVMHASELAQGNYWQKKISEEALKALGPQDLCGVIHWNGSEEWLWGKPQGLIKVGPNRRRMQALLGRMTPGDMPDFDPSLKLAAGAFRACTEAAIKHMIVISDGDPSPASSGVLSDFVKQGIKITTVAVGTHGPAGSQELQRIARATNGKYYVVNNPQALPRIFQREARRVARPLVKETVVTPIIKSRHEILQGIDGPLPPIRGFVLTNVKKNPLVEVSLISPDPATEENATLLAAWTYGLGRTAVLTTDAGKRWADNWVQWEGYDKLFSQLVRWSMRPTGDQGSFTVATDYSEGKVRVVVTALDKNDELLNFLNMNASVVGPDMATNAISVQQTAPGRYVGEFAADQSGSYFITLVPGGEHALIRTGVTVPYSAEFRELLTNRELLERLANREAKGGDSGQLIEGPMIPGQIEPLLSSNPFRRDLPRAISSRDVWPLLVLLASTVFFADVFVRRVHVNFDWTKPMYEWTMAKLGRRNAAPEVDERMERLRRRKRQIEGALDDRRAATRFEPSPDADVNLDVLDEGKSTTKPNVSAADGPRQVAPEKTEEEDYTSRLLRAKRQARKGQNPDQEA
ncbi:MAG: VWA domain-containing protein [Planctomycetales bacterium]|nr:VWA domain-containing protein [Planctomycetales bacterium]